MHNWYQKSVFHVLHILTLISHLFIDVFSLPSFCVLVHRYRAEGHGLQDAKKGSRFLHFPPVLQLQLKRFEYDPFRDTMVKINDRFEFPTELNLEPYLPEDKK